MMRQAADFSIFDIHHHVGSVGVYATLADSTVPEAVALEAAVKRRIDFMDQHDVEAVLLMPGSGYAMLRGIQTRAT